MFRIGPITSQGGATRLLLVLKNVDRSVHMTTSPQTASSHPAVVDGGFNFRDMGGHKTEDGRTMRRGQVYRSGMMVHLTDADHVLLDGLGVRVICDLRTTREQLRDPTRWQNIR